MTNLERGLISSVLVSFGTLLYSVWSNNKQTQTLAKISENVNVSQEILKSDPSTHISEEFIRGLTSKVVEERLVRCVKHEVDISHKNAIKDRISYEVESYYSKIRKELEIELSQRISDQVDTNAVRREVERKAAQLIEEKLDDKFDSILEAFNHNLATTSKIYESIADTVKSKVVSKDS